MSLKASYIYIYESILYNFYFDVKAPTFESEFLEVLMSEKNGYLSTFCGSFVYCI